jgi:ATP-dependent helicase HepA
MLNNFHQGQRWVSVSEPELGLGAVLRFNERTVTMVFGASGEKREYARDNAPLRRVRFRVGDTIKSHDENAFVVQSITESKGLIFYRGEGHNLCETDLSNAISFNKPQERLLAAQVDPTEVFDLRFAALKQQHKRRKSTVRGFTGGRIDLIPHQLYIAAEVAGRLVPRVLLADEVGLGKTIEACLILHRLLQTGRAKRVLILVPESLVHQWFVELLRRFNLWFHIFDEERCEAIEGTNPETNPFLDDQLILCSNGLFIQNEQRIAQATAAGWDVLVVDEAHHLGWSPELVSPEYAVVETLGKAAAGLLLLTATPEQLGVASHFARLRLLDPNRFYDLNEFIKEADQYRVVAGLAQKLIEGQTFTAEEFKTLSGILVQDEQGLRAKVEKLSQDKSVALEELIGALLDQHGTGRVMFRNTRSTITGFPKRKTQLHLLPPDEDQKLFTALADEFAADIDVKTAATFKPDFANDPRIAWLVELLRTLDNEKVLLICRTQRKVEAIESALRQQINITIGVFHEGLPLVQRDRNAAWFADEDGARLLICSEIGSEGRNFQFSHHLVLFDLPLDPELLEQRIGRLDRIGQTSEIQVHVPFVVGSSQEVLARWYGEGLNSFEKNLHGGRALLEQFRTEVHDLAQDFHETERTSRPDLGRLIEKTKQARKELTQRLEQGRDRLLELNSFRAPIAAKLVTEISEQDKDESLDEFMLSVFDHFSIHLEELSKRSYQLGSAGVFADSFPGLPAEGITVTCDRQRALSREDIQFLSWDHPLVTGALDLLLGSEKGNSSFAKWTDKKVAGLYVEAVYLLECIAPAHLHFDRFLPPTPLRILVDHRGQDVGLSLTPDILRVNLKNGEAYTLLERPEVRDELLPDLIEKTEAIGRSLIPGFVAQARKEMALQLDHEITRLKELQRVNRSVRSEEVDLLVQERSDLQKCLGEARLRLDCLRVIQRGPG